MTGVYSSPALDGIHPRSEAAGDIATGHPFMRLVEYLWDGALWGFAQGTLLVLPPARVPGRTWHLNSCGRPRPHRLNFVRSGPRCPGRLGSSRTVKNVSRLVSDPAVKNAPDLPMNNGSLPLENASNMGAAVTFTGVISARGEVASLDRRLAAV